MEIDRQTDRWQMSRKKKLEPGKKLRSNDCVFVSGNQEHGGPWTERRKAGSVAGREGGDGFKG